MEPLTLLFGIPFIIAGWNQATRKHTDRQAARDAPREYVEKAQKDDDWPTDAEREAMRRDRAASAKNRVRFE
jgi:hypothetical protein